MEIEVLPLLISSKKAIVIDTETNITNFQEERYCMGIALCIDNDCFYIPTHHNDWGKGNITSVDTIGMFDKLANVPIIFHNAKFDIPVLAKIGLQVPKNQVYDTMIMAHLINEDQRSFELDDLVRVHLGIRKDVKLAAAMKQFKWEHVPAYIFERYAIQDAQITYNLYWYLKNHFEPYEKVWEVDREFMYLLMDMERKGIRLDRDKTKISLYKNELWLDEFKKRLGFDPGKKKDLQKYFFKTLGLKPLTFTPSRHDPQINTNFLEKTDHPACKEFRGFKEIEKRVTSYYRPYLRLAPNGRFHPSYKQHGTVTGRPSCSDPNMFQIPRDSDIKEFFLPEEGCELWEIDYNTIELRLIAVYSQDPRLLKAFKEDGDVHKLTADLIGVVRQKGKEVNFTIGYEGGPTVLKFRLNITLEAAKDLHTAWHNAYPNVKKKSKEAQYSAEANGGKIKMWSGRHRHFFFAGDYYKAFNSIIQGGAFEITKLSSLKLQQAGFDIRNIVYDSVWLNIPVGEVDVKIKEAEGLMSDWTEDLFGLRFSVESKRLA